MSKKELKNPIAKYNEPLAEDQAMAKKIIKNNVLTTLRGVAGTGKTFLAVCYALERYNMERRKGGIDGIVMTRPMVSPKDREVGFLPGDLNQKIDPYLQPIQEIIKKLDGNEVYERMIKDGDLTIAPLVVVKGRTFTKKIVIVDEAADLTNKDVEALFTRIGKGSQMIFMGDMRQCDLDHVKLSGFPRLCEMASKCESVGDFELTTNFRDPIVRELLEKYSYE